MRNPNEEMLVGWAPRTFPQYDPNITALPPLGNIKQPNNTELTCRVCRGEKLISIHHWDGRLALKTCNRCQGVGKVIL